MNARNAEDLHIGDRVRHADGAGSVARVVRFWAWPDVVVRWESTGRESTENLYLLIRVED